MAWPVFLERMPTVGSQQARKVGVLYLTRSWRVSSGSRSDATIGVPFDGKQQFSSYCPWLDAHRADKWEHRVNVYWLIPEGVSHSLHFRGSLSPLNPNESVVSQFVTPFLAGWKGAGLGSWGYSNLQREPTGTRSSVAIRIEAPQSGTFQGRPWRSQPPRLRSRGLGPTEILSDVAMSFVTFRPTRALTKRDASSGRFGFFPFVLQRQAVRLQAQG